MTQYKNPIPHIHLQPGKISVLQHPAVVSTILGSCVAVTLYNKRLGLAAISHSLLPHCRHRAYICDIHDILAADCSRCKETFKYVDCSIAMMLAAFAGQGVKPFETEVQLYGGSKMFIAGDKKNMTVGLLNCNTAQKVLSDHGFEICASDTGGPVGRKIIFNTQTGKVTLNRLDKYLDYYGFPVIKDASHAHSKKN